MYFYNFFFFAAHATTNRAHDLLRLQLIFIYASGVDLAVCCSNCTPLYPNFKRLKIVYLDVAAVASESWHKCQNLFIISFKLGPNFFKDLDFYFHFEGYMAAIVYY